VYGLFQELAYLLLGKMSLVLTEEESAEIPEPDLMISRKETFLAFRIETRFLDFLSLYLVSFGGTLQSGAREPVGEFIKLLCSYLTGNKLGIF